MAEEWLACDEAVRIKTAELNALREKRRVLGERLVSEGGTHPLVRVVSRRLYTPLTFSFLEESLLEVISDKEMVDELMQHVRERRECTVVKEIRRNTQRTFRRQTPQNTTRKKILKKILKEN